VGCKQINSDIDKTNDRRGLSTLLSVQQVCKMREVRHEHQSMERTQASSDSTAQTEAPPRSQQESNPLPRENHRSTSLGSGHKNDRLRYRPTEYRPIDSTDPTTTDRVPLCGSCPELARAPRGNGEAIGKEDEGREKEVGKQGKERFKRD